MKKTENNYAFIDSQNLNLGIRGLGWRLDYRKFRIYLEEIYSARKAYIFIGFIAENQDLYDNLQRAGFELVFKPIIIHEHDVMKGNVDADLVLRAMIEYGNYERAIIVSSDGDFYSLVEYLHKMDKLKVILSPDFKNCSRLLRQASKEKIRFLDNLRKKLEYK